jgi:RNA polymerase sigma factor (sigma-70 family)
MPGVTPQAPDQEWLLALVASHQASLTHYAARLVGDVEKARDLVQETFLKLWGEGPGAGGDNPAAWLFTVCRNLAFDNLRKEKRMVPLTGTEELASSGEAPDQALTSSQGLSGVLAALDRLPKNQQEVLRLKFQNGLSYKDISRITGHSVSHVGVMIHTGVKTLRQNLKGGAK